MSDKPETLAAVFAEMRDLADHRAADAGGERPGIELLRSYADRIEAAAERERNAHTNDIHDALYKATGIPGNAAALREALESIEDDCRVLDRKDMWEEEGECYYDALRDIREKVNTALAAPARNCDRFATELDARLAWKRETHCKGDYRYWLFDPAEGGTE